MIDLVTLSASRLRQERSRNRLQLARVRRLIAHAEAHVPYYRDLLRGAGVRAADIRDLEDLARIPSTDKATLRALGVREITAGNVDLSRCRRVSTSGSTGRPLELLFLESDLSKIAAAWARAALTSGARPWDRRLEITGPHQVEGRRRHWYQRLGAWDRAGVSIFEHPEGWVEAWRRSRPDILWGYAGSLKLLAAHVLENDIQDLRPRVVIGVSEWVEPDTRGLVETAFDTPLIDLYGAAESGLIARRCIRCNGYHASTDTVVVEVLHGDRPAGPGEPGHIVVTNLFSFAMPIIRYEIGDVGLPMTDPPRCGRSRPMLSSIEGRADAFLVLKTGSILSPMACYSLFKAVPGARQWRVHQTDSGVVEVTTVPAGGSVEEVTDQITSAFRRQVGADLAVQVHVVESIPPDRSGKVRAVTSDLASDLLRTDGSALSDRVMPEHLPCDS